MISSTRKNKISDYIIDETILKIGPDFIWLWVTINPETDQILAQGITKERNMLIAECFLSGVVRYYGKHPVSTDGDIRYPQACEFLKIDHIYSSFEKSLIERIMQCIKDRTKCFNDYFPCGLKIVN
jgi:putative transposase